MQRNQLTSVPHLPPEQAVELLLGVSAKDLYATATQYYQKVLSAGKLQPNGSGGTLGWIYATEAIRAHLISKGWTPSDPSNQPRIVSPDGKHAITVMRGDIHTGNPHRTPLTRNKRGNRTVKSVHFNAAQQDMFPVSRDERQVLVEATEQTLWVLLFHADINNKVVNYELSRPINMGENGKVDDWKPRFILPQIDFNAPTDYQMPEPSPDLDIMVTPKA